MDPELSAAVRNLGDQISSMLARVQRLEAGARQAGLKYSSVDGGALTVNDGSLIVNDGAGVRRVVVGAQADGSVTTNVYNAPPPGVPSTPTLLVLAGGLAAGWDGLLGGLAPKSDFLWTEVHVSASPGFTPTAATLAGVLHTAGSYPVTGLTAGTTYYVVLVARNEALTAGTASAQASAVPTAPSGVKATVSASAPASPGTGDLWWDSGNGYRINQWSGTAWTPYQYGTSAIAAGAITTTQIAAAAAITGSQLASGAGILGTQLAANAAITSGQVSFTARAIGGITTTVAASAPGSPATGDLWFDTTAGYKLNQYSAGAWHPYQYGTSALAAGSITAAVIAANTITATQIASGTITATQVQAHTLTANEIAGGTITATQIAAGTITAGLLATGIVMAGIVDATTIEGARLIADGATGQVLVYAGDPQSGNLVFSISGQAYTDAYGNQVPIGLALNAGTMSGVAIDSPAIIAPAIAGGSGDAMDLTNPAMSGGTAYDIGVTFDTYGGQLLLYSTANSATPFATAGVATWTCPPTAHSAKVELWGADAGAGGGNPSGGGEGGGAGEYGCHPSYPVVPSRSYQVVTGTGGQGGTTGNLGGSGSDSSFDQTGVQAQGGQAGGSGIGGLGGDAGTAPIHYKGGNGAGDGTQSTGGCGGGGRAGSTGPGGNGLKSSSSAGAAGGAAGTGTGGHTGGTGGAAGASGNPGGGGGGAGAATGVSQGTSTYRLSGSASYYGSDGGNPNAQRDIGTMYQGGEAASGGSWNGTQKSLGIISGNPAADLAGKTIDAVSIRLEWLHTWYSDGAYVILGYTSRTSLPSTWDGSGIVGVDTWWQGNVGYAEPHDLTNKGLGSALASGAAKSICLGPGTPNLNEWNYGYMYGAGGDDAQNPRLTVSWHTTGGSVVQGGKGADGLVTVTTQGSQSLLGSVAAAAFTDAVTGSAVPAGFMGPITAVSPTVSPAAAETWQNVTPPSGWSGYMRYKMVAEARMMFVDLAITHSALSAKQTLGQALTLFTLPAAYRPAKSMTLPCTESNSTGLTFPMASIYAGSGGGVVAYYLDAGTTGVDCHFAFPLD